ncbi:MAG: hypothetical protein ACXABY_19065 [Candidatus Thorarchaeota archaeon]|jgi:hypothetical protein
MSCEICGSSSCTESFHSIEEQIAHEKGVPLELVARDSDVGILEERITQLEADSKRLDSIIRLKMIWPWHPKDRAALDAVIEHFNRGKEQP